MPGNAQAKINEMSRSALGNVGKLTSKMPMNMINQFSESKNVPLADVTKKIAVG